MNKPTRTVKRWTEPGQTHDGTTDWADPAIEHEQETEALHSVTLTVNAKGGVQPEVKVYDADIQEAERLALESLRRIQQALIDTPISGLRPASTSITDKEIRS